MTSEQTPDIFQRAWQDQPVDPPPSLAEIRRRAAHSTRRFIWRNTREQVAGVLLLLVISTNIVRGGFDGARDLGNLLALLGVAYVMYQIHTRGAVRPLPSALGMTAAAAFYRRELAHQRDLLRSVWRWYLLPLLPGLLVFVVASGLDQPAYWSRAIWNVAGAAVVLRLIVWMNMRAAARLQRAITDLDALASTDGITTTDNQREPLLDVVPSWVSTAVVVALMPLQIGGIFGMVPSHEVGAPIPTPTLWWLALSFVGALLAQATAWTVRRRKS